MDMGIFKSKTTIASVALLVLSGVRFFMGDTTALSGIQEAIASLVPLLLRSAMYSDTQAVLQDAAAPPAAPPAPRMETPYVG